MTDERTDRRPGWTPTRCARCDAAFDCGAALPVDGPGCWCTALPALAAPARDEAGAMLAGCLCPACLRAELARPGGGASGWPARNDAQ